MATSRHLHQRTIASAFAVALPLLLAACFNPAERPADGGSPEQQVDVMQPDDQGTELPQELDVGSDATDGILPPDTTSCGNGEIDGTDECDGDKLPFNGCSDVPNQNYTGGTLSCSKCKLDTSKCYGCGDGQLNPGEDCDGSQLGGKTCKTEGFDGGTLGCTSQCVYDTTKCTQITCPDGKIDTGEDCDGLDLNNATCKSLGYDGGTLECSPTSCTYDNSACYKCGDGQKNGSEQCDSFDVGGATCGSLGQGFFGGQLTCQSNCTFDTSSCHRCGNGQIDSGEECDGSNFGSNTCQTEGFDAGQLACGSDCKLITSGCKNCDCQIGGYCLSDGETLPGQRCDGCSKSWSTTQPTVLAKPGCVANVSGTSGNASYADGPLHQAEFNNLEAVTVTPDGSLWIVERYHCVRRVYNGQVTTVLGKCGTGGSTLVGSSGTSTRLAWPRDIASDAAGAIYVADAGNYRVLKYHNGQVTKYAGGQYGSTDGPAGSARFTYISALAFNSQGALFLADSDNNKIRKVANGQVTTVAGSGAKGYFDGPALSAKFDYPKRLRISSNDTVYIGDASPVLRKLSNGTVSTVAGDVSDKSHKDGVGTAARFDSAIGELAWGLDGGLYMLVGQYLRRFDRATSSVTTVFGAGAADSNADGKIEVARYWGNVGAGLHAGADGALYLLSDRRVRVIMLKDRDGDGHEAESLGGADCDDTNPTIYGGAPDSVGDGIDQNCDGKDG